MEYILATVRCGDINDDLKIPSDIPVGELTDMINELYGTDCKTLHANPKGMICDKSRTLSQQEIGHGAILTLI